MDEETIHQRIEALVAEEHQLWESEGGNPERQREIGERLDQWYDLLRQRRALRSAGRDPEEAELRDVSQEGYPDNP
jgi:hypothetical protein